jgi:hypothetical protein
MKLRHPLLCAALTAALLATGITRADDEQRGPFMVFRNPSGLAATFNTAGPLDLRNPFFQKLGTNGRSCDTCHQPGDGWTVTPASIQARFEATKGLDPIFRTNDGSNSPDADVSTLEARRAAYSMLLTKGLIRVGIGIPDNSEFELAAVDDPYGFASAAELSLFRRPLPSANLKFLSTVMWDGRETFTTRRHTTASSAPRSALRACTSISATRRTARRSAMRRQRSRCRRRSAKRSSSSRRDSSPRRCSTRARSS